MNFKICIIFIFVLLQSIISAQDSEFTVMAKSGLNLREYPSINSKILFNIPFGSIVQDRMAEKPTRIYYNEGIVDTSFVDFNYEGVKGFWHKVLYVDVIGYVFSGFLTPGNKIDGEKPSSGYVLLSTGYKCYNDKIKYRNDYTYYLIEESTDSITFTEVEVDFELMQNYSDEFKQKNDDTWFNFSCNVILKNSDKQGLLIGARTKMEGYTEVKSPPHRYGNGEYGKMNGNFLYPEQAERHYYNDNLIEIKGIVIPELINDEIDLKYSIRYTMYRRGTSNKIFYKDLNLGVMVHPQKHAYFQTPKVHIVSDFNQDGILDLIIFSMTMSESCGVCWTHELFISNKNIMTKIEKVSEKSICNCVT